MLNEYEYLYNRNLIDQIPSTSINKRRIDNTVVKLGKNKDRLEMYSNVRINR